MAAAFIHFFLGMGIAFLFGYTGLEAVLLGLIGAVQDLDFFSLFFHERLMKSGSTRLLMHRGLTHTFLFAFACSAVVFVFSPVFSLFVLVNFLLHIFTDYVTAWGVAPFQPLSDKRYSLGLMTIFDAPLTVLSALIGGSGFFSVSPVFPFAAFFGYIFVRFLLKRRLQCTGLVPMGNLTYAFCFPENDYRAGKVDILGRNEMITVPKVTGEIDSQLVQKIEDKIGGSMLSHFLEYPTYSAEDDSIIVRDARSYLFPRSSRLGFTVLFERGTENLYMLAAGRKIGLR